MKTVFLIPGFLNSTIGDLSNADKVWFDPNVAILTGIGRLRLAPDGVNPGPPDGVDCGVSLVPMDPWPAVEASLKSQLDPAVWQVATLPYDWRFDLTFAAAQVSANIISHVKPISPLTIVAHSAGGLVAVLAWQNLVAAGNSNLVRRIITIGTPFQGSYSPVSWLNGLSPSVQQLLAFALLSGPWALRPVAFWTLNFLNKLALSWPAFYELFPQTGGTDAVGDPNRVLLYTAANFPPAFPPQQTWLDYTRTAFQPSVNSPNTFPPQWVATYIYGTGAFTANSLKSATLPLALYNLGNTQDGDGVVTHLSAVRSPGKIVQCCGTHASLPLALAQDGTLAREILDPRGPLSPPPSKLIIVPPLGQNVTDPPEVDYVNQLACIGGHC